jgi:hypothetical protein
VSRLHEEEPILLEHLEDGAEEELEVGQPHVLGHLDCRDRLKGLRTEEWCGMKKERGSGKKDTGPQGG